MAMLLVDSPQPLLRPRPLARLFAFARGTIRPKRKPKPFKFVRWFLVVSLAWVAVSTVVAATAMSAFLMRTMLQRDAEVTAEFVNGIVRSEDLLVAYERRDPATLAHRFEHLARLPDLFRALVFMPDHTVLWSNEPNLVGKRYEDDDELDEAFAGKLEIFYERWPHGERRVHARSKAIGHLFIEDYIPIYDANRSSVIGVVELYRHPGSLFDAIDNGTRLVWLGALASGALLFAVLFGIVWRANSIMRFQEAELISSKMLSAVGQMVTAVAHSFRNPLSVIRSSAELAAEMPESPDTPRTLNEIIRHVDRLDQEVRDLLGYFPRGNGGLQPLPVNEVVVAAAKIFDTQFVRRGITPSMQLRQPSLVARSNAASLSKVVDNAIANAVEAMPEGGTLTLKVEPAADRRFIEIRVIDTGHGIDGQAMPQIGKPFVTTKKKGLGLGLTLSRSIMEGLGGSFELRSAAGIGTEAIIRVPAAS